MKAVLEGLLFISGDDGITVQEIMNTLDMNEEEVTGLLNEYANDLSSDERGLELKKFGSIYKLVTKNCYAHYYKKYAEQSVSRNLSQSALETLAIIAYNEPITRVEIDELRGINSSQMLRNLVARDFIKEVGRSDKPGRPILYGVTDSFMDYFGITSKDDLPLFVKDVL